MANHCSHRPTVGQYAPVPVGSVEPPLVARQKARKTPTATGDAWTAITYLPMAVGDRPTAVGLGLLGIVHACLQSSSSAGWPDLRFLDQNTPALLYHCSTLPGLSAFSIVLSFGCQCNACPLRTPINLVMAPIKGPQCLVALHNPDYPCTTHIASQPSAIFSLCIFYKTHSIFYGVYWVFCDMHSGFYNRDAHCIFLRYI